MPEEEEEDKFYLNTDSLSALLQLYLFITKKIKFASHLLVQIHTAHMTPPIPATNAREATMI